MKTRSFLFVPVKSAKIITKGLQLPADKIIFDLEDAVALSEKDRARTLLKEELQKQTNLPNNLYVRINELSSPFWEEDLKTVLSFPSLKLVIPKVNETNDIYTIDEKIKTLGHTIQEIVPIIETGKGLWNAKEIACSSEKIKLLAFGAVDYSLDVGIDPSSSGYELLHAKSQLVLSSRVADIEPPIDAVYTAFTDQGGFIKEAELAKRLGFQGKLLIHPNQIDDANEAFSPSDAELTYAKKIVSAFHEAESNGLASIEVDGKMVDYPVMLKAKKLLDVYVR